jgi:hypothetical protein
MPTSFDRKRICVKDVDMAPEAVGIPAPATASSGRRWRDRKLLLWPLALIVPLLPLRMTELIGQDAHPIRWLMAPIVVFGVVPLIDVLFGLDKRNPPESEFNRLSGRRYYRWVTYAYIPLQYAGLVLACWMWARAGLRWWEASRSSAASASTRPTSWATSGRRWSAGCRRSCSPRRPTATSSSSTTGATT